MAAVDAESCAVVATAADIICSLRGADLAGWTPPWRKVDAGAPALPSACDGRQEAGEEEGGDTRGLAAWPAMARGKRSRSRRAGSPSASGSVSAGAAAAAKEDVEEKNKTKNQGRRGGGVRGSPASPLDYSGGSGSGASTSGGEDGAFCSQPPPSTAAAAVVFHSAAAPSAATATAAAAAPNKVPPRG
nr:unnamed protein product [Digitaria exilis]